MLLVAQGEYTEIMNFLAPSFLFRCIDGGTRVKSLGVYVHIPFCQARCRFCAFYVQIHREGRVQKFLDALGREIELYADQVRLSGIPVTTVYFGGGTPTTLSPDQLCWILKKIQTHFVLHENAEVSLEGHPESVKWENLLVLVRAGFNRLSLGAQSFSNIELARLGGRASGAVTRVAIAAARKAGFENINLDFMYGLTGQTMKTWVATLHDAIALAPSHISCYALTLEEGSQFYVEHRRGDLDEPDTSLQIAMQEEAVYCLAQSGYERYEISNFSKPGYACRHNLRYWRGEAYLGLGPSAQSYIDPIRFGNEVDLQCYGDILKKKKLPVMQVEMLSQIQASREKTVFGLRMTDGVSIDELSGNVLSGHQWAKNVQGLMAQGLLKEKGRRLTLTSLGRHYADSVAVALL